MGVRRDRRRRLHLRLVDLPGSRGHGGLAGAIATPHVINTANGPLLEFPISVVPLRAGASASSVAATCASFRTRSSSAWRARVNAGGQPVVYYVHPREIDPDHPRMPMSAKRRFKTYVNLRTTAGKLRAIMDEGGVINFKSWIAAHGDTLPIAP